MSLTAGCLCAFARATAVGAAAAVAGLAVQGPLLTPPGRSGPTHVRTTRRRRQGLIGGNAAWALLLVPYLAPTLLVGYGWSGVSLSLVRHPALNEILYGLLLCMRLTPVAALAVRFAPRSMSDEALYCHALLLHEWPGSTTHARPIPAGPAAGPAGVRRLSSAFAFWLRGRGRAACAAFALVFLFTFGDFELASLLGRPSWTVSLFDAQVGGAFLSESFRLALVPLVSELAVFGLAAAVVFGGRSAGSEARGGAARGTSRPRARTARSAHLRGALVWVYLVTAAALVAVVPAVVVLRGTFGGLGVLAENFVLGKDIVAGALFALGATALAYLVAQATFARRGGRLLTVSLVSVPGLLGALLLSLVVLATFQLPGLDRARGTPLPLLVTLALLLVPYACFLAFLFLAFRPRESLHLAGLLKGSREAETGRRASGLLWQLDTRKRFWAGFLLFWWGYFDLTASSILAPAGMTPVSVRLYNLMHYGEMPVLSAMVAAAVVVPLAALAFAAAGWRLYGRFMAGKAGTSPRRSGFGRAGGSDGRPAAEVP